MSILRGVTTCNENYFIVNATVLLKIIKQVIKQCPYSVLLRDKMGLPYAIKFSKLVLHEIIISTKITIIKILFYFNKKVMKCTTTKLKLFIYN